MGRDHSETCETCGWERGGLNDYECACASPGLALGARHGALIEAAERLSNLALCLRDAAFGEVMFRAGGRHGGIAEFDHLGRPVRFDWKPGCGRPIGEWP